MFDSRTAVAWAAAGEKVILVRRETNPDDLHGMIAAEGVLTSRGGKTSHAAVVARGMGKTCVCGAEELEVDAAGKQFTTPDGVVVSEGDVISVDGTSGAVYLGEVPVIASNVVQYFEGELAPDCRRARRRRARDHDPRRRRAAPRRAGQRRQRPGLRAGPPVRRGRASAWCGPSTCSSASAASWSRT